MAVNYIAALKTNRMQDVADIINAKTITAGDRRRHRRPKLVIGTSGAVGRHWRAVNAHAVANPVRHGVGLGAHLHAADGGQRHCNRCRGAGRDPNHGRCR